MESRSPFFLAATGISALALSLACGGGSGGPAALSTGGGNGTVAMSMSDASTEDWATIGVKLLGIALVPQGGSASSAVTVYKAPTPAPTINLVQDSTMSEILGNVQVAAGTYTQAILTLSANPGDVYLTSAADPSASFAGAPSTTYGQGANASRCRSRAPVTGATGGKTVTATVNLVQPLVVSANANNSLDLEFDLSHPAFIVGHVTAAAQSLVWAVDFDGPMLRHHPCRLTDMVLRHLYGTVTAVSTDNTALTLSKDYPTWPIVSPETENTSSVSLPVLGRRHQRHPVLQPRQQPDHPGHRAELLQPGHPARRQQRGRQDHLRPGGHPLPVQRHPGGRPGLHQHLLQHDLHQS